MGVARMHVRWWLAATMVAASVIVPVSRTVRAEIAGGATVDPSGTAVATRAAMGYVDAGDAHTCVVAAAWSVVCAGSGQDGRLGTGSTVDVGDDPSETGAALQAVPLGTGRTARAVATGDAHSCALLDDGRVKCWGGNGSGQLGVGDSDARGDGPGEMGDALPFVNLGSGRTAVAIAAGGNHTCALLDDGRVKCWGANAAGQLGISSTTARGRKASDMGDALPSVAMPGGRLAVAVAAGDSHSCAILADSSLVCWGEGVGGRLGQGGEARIGDDPARAVASAPVVSVPRPVVAVAAGRLHTCAVLDDATLRCWGTGLDGRLGTGSTDARGDQPGEMGASLPAIDVGASRGVRAVAAGGSHTCAVLDDGSLRCFGLGSHGQLGSGGTASIGDQAGEMGAALAAVPVGPVVAVAAGTAHTCVLRWGGGMRCVGNGMNGRLATGATASIGDQPGEVAALGDAATPSLATVPTTTSTTTSSTTTTTSTTTSTTTVPPTTTTTSTTTSTTTVPPTTTTTSTTTSTTTTSTTTSTITSTTTTSTTTSTTVAPTTTASRSSGGGDDRRTTTSTTSTVVPSSASGPSESPSEVRAIVTALPPFPLGQSGVSGALARELARWVATVPLGAVVRCTAVGGTTAAIPSLARARAQAVCATVAALGHRTVVEVVPVRAARVRWRRSGAVGPLPTDAFRRVLVEVADGTGR